MVGWKGCARDVLVPNTPQAFSIPAGAAPAQASAALQEQARIRHRVDNLLAQVPFRESLVPERFPD